MYDNDELYILEHEKIHLKQRHWLDLFFVEVLKIILWWNPFIYKYQQELSNIHEYIADKKVLEKQSVTTYFNKVLQQSFNIRNISFINQFYKPSILKKRIMMQKKEQSKQIKKLKFIAFAIILLAVGLVLDACQNEVKNTEELSVEKKVEVQKTETPQDSEDKEVTFQLIKMPPVFPGCEEKEPKEAKECFSKKIQKFVIDNFNTKLAEKLNLEGGKVKIMTQFAIGTDGKVGDIKVRAKFPELADEAKRVISQLPQMKPAYQDDELVKVRYTLPIIFKVTED